MLRLNLAMKLLAVFFIGIMASNCAKSFTTDKTIKPEDFSKEIARLEAIAKGADLSAQPKAHLQLALLYSHYKNPNSDYIVALKELETYISLDQEGGTATEIQNLLAILRKLKKITDENKQLAQENNQLKIKAEQMFLENSEIKKTVEQLKHLDIRMEEKRKEVK